MAGRPRPVGRRKGRRLAGPVLAAVLAGTVFAGAAQAAPANDATLVYSFTDCVGHRDFQAVKQPSGAASVHLLDGSGVFLFMRAVVLGDQGDLLDGTVLFNTRGITSGAANVETITCEQVSPTSGIRALITGFMAPSH